MEELVLVMTPDQRKDTFEIQLLHIFLSFFFFFFLVALPL